MVKNIVFDLGNVLLKFNPEKIIKVYQKNLKEEIYNNIFDSKEWVMLDRGEISSQYATKKFIEKMPDHEKIIREIMNSWDDYLKPIDENLNLLKELSKSPFNLYVLSNFHKDAFKKVSNKYNFFDYFTGMVISYQENTVKPEEDIYQILIDRFNLNPNITLFIDDKRENIKQAEKMGFKTIHFNDSIKLSKSIYEHINKSKE